MQRMISIIKKLFKIIIPEWPAEYIRKMLIAAKKRRMSYFKRARDKKSELFFRFFYKRKKPHVKIILNDYSEYPLYRKKVIFQNVIDCGIGNFFDNVERHMAGVDFEIILIITSEDSESKEIMNRYESLNARYPFIKKILLIDNNALDIGAYNMGFQYLKSIGYRGDIVFMNSSVRGPYSDYWLLKYSYLFHRKKDIGLCGMSINTHTTHVPNSVFSPHVQSLFIYTSMEILTEVFGDSLLSDNMAKLSKLDIISKYEIGWSEKVLDRGYGIRSVLFENFIYYKGAKWKIPMGDPRMNPLYIEFANVL